MSENNVSYMNNCVYLKLDISIWTGKARLTPKTTPVPWGSFRPMRVGRSVASAS